MKELKVHIPHVILWEFKNYKNATETAKKICSVYDQNIITDHQVWNWYLKFCSGDTERWTQTRMLIKSWSRCF